MCEHHHLYYIKEIKFSLSYAYTVIDMKMNHLSKTGDPRVDDGSFMPLGSSNNAAFSDVASSVLSSCTTSEEESLSGIDALFPDTARSASACEVVLTTSVTGRMSLRVP